MKNLYIALVALLAAFGFATPASAQTFVTSTEPLTYFCSEQGYVISDQTGLPLRYRNGDPLPCPETVLEGETGSMSLQAPDQPPVIVIVKSYPDYRGWGLDSNAWRIYWSDIGSRIYYQRYHRQRAWNDGYRAAVRDTRQPSYGRRTDVNNRRDDHPYRQQYGTWGGNRNGDTVDGRFRFRHVAQGGSVRRGDRPGSVTVDRRQVRQDGSGEIARYQRRYERRQPSFESDRRDYVTVQRRYDRGDVQVERRRYRNDTSSGNRGGWSNGRSSRSPRQHGPRPRRSRN